MAAIAMPPFMMGVSAGRFRRTDAGFPGFTAGLAPGVGCFSATRIWSPFGRPGFSGFSALSACDPRERRGRLGGGASGAPPGGGGGGAPMPGTGDLDDDGGGG